MRFAQPGGSELGVLVSIACATLSQWRASAR